MGNYVSADVLSKKALEVSAPQNDIFVERPINDYEILVQFANCSYLTEKYAGADQAIEILLANPRLPSEIRELMKNNHPFIKSHLND